MCVCVYVCVYVCVCYQSPVRAVCQNHEVVVLQPWTVTASDLGSVANITTIISLQTHLLQSCSGYTFPLLPRPISYRSPILHLLMPLISLFEPAYPLPPHPDRTQSNRTRLDMYMDVCPIMVMITSFIIPQNVCAYKRRPKR